MCADRSSEPAPERARTRPRVTPRVVVLVEGSSDAAAVLALCAARGLDASVDRFEVVDMGGVTNVGSQLGRIGADSGAPRVLGLCDAPEEGFVIRALQRRGLDVETRQDLEHQGFFVCDRDLEDELIRALGPARVESALEALGQLERFRAFQRQPQWRGRPVHDQLRRFAGTTSGRKTELARRLAEDLTPVTIPRPLARLVDALAAALGPGPGAGSTA